jgi:ATP-binding cassette subfamily F protein uup
VKTFAEIFPLAKGGSLSTAQFLELFLFPPEKQYTYLDSLSGGEKKRLQLLTILFRNPNFLILDEPTNDLDLPTLSVLENFLSDYQGCLLIVSHDRYFMDRLVDHLFVFEGNGEVKDFPGNYTQYRLWMKEQEKYVISRQPAVKEEEQNTDYQKQAGNKRKASFKEKREFEILEKEIAELETERQQIQNQLSDAGAPYERLNLLSKRIGEISTLLNEKEMRWLELSEII